ncbi:MAG TPA: glutathione peroxidase [Bacteroidota bacterium]|nr:glutathione peroxidase [Bacteroidota bacterium]
MKSIVDYVMYGLFSLFAQPAYAEPGMESDPKLYSFVMQTIDGEQKSLADYQGKVLMIVNVASFCGYTPQYEGLQQIYERYRERGFEILAFPANNFAGQEPGANEEIKEFCTTKYNVSFQLFSKISVKGDDQHPMYRYITLESPLKGEIRWNFQKYLVDRKGNLVAMFPTRIKPTDSVVIKKIEKLLSE